MNVDLDIIKEILITKKINLGNDLFAVCTTLDNDKVILAQGSSHSCLISFKDYNRRKNLKDLLK